MKAKTKNLILAIAVSVIAIFIPSLLFSKWIEGIVFFFCHWLIREQFPKQYHHIIPAMCRLLTSVIFFFGVSFILPLGFSLMSAVPINYFIGWVGFTKKQADTFQTKCERLKAEIEAKNQFNTDTCTEAELIERCRELRMSEENISLAVDLFIRKVPHKQLSEKYFIETDSIKKKRLRMKNKLNNQ